MSDWDRLRINAYDSLRVLGELLEDPRVDDRRLVSGYVEAKTLLADAFQAFSLDRFASPDVLARTKKQLEREMRERYPRLPANHLRVRGFGKSHSLLLAYLYRFHDSPVPASELRMLTGDAVHTERRTRELRDLGFSIDATQVAGRNVYRLQTRAPDLLLGASRQVSANIKRDKSLSMREKQLLLREARSASNVRRVAEP